MRRITKLKNILLLAFVGTLLTVLPLSAQETDGSRVLNNGIPVVGAIDTNNAAQIYSFAANRGDSVTLTLTPEAGLILQMILSDSRGNNLGQVQVDGNAPGIGLPNIPLPQIDSYYVTVFPATGTATATEGTFTLQLDVIAAALPATSPPAQPTQAPTAAATQPAAAPVTFQQGQVTLLNGMEVNLTWNTRDDLNLEVRDPQGETLYFNSRSTSTNGAFGLDVNGLCEVLTDPPATETASWPGGAHLTGSYEVLVYYREPCVGRAPVDFTLNITVDGLPLAPIQGNLQPPVDDNATVFISSFTVDADGSASVGAAGPYTDTRVLPLPASDLLALPATPVQLEEVQSGTIVNQQPWLTYQFSGEAGENVSIQMTAVQGNLDPLLLVLDSSGNIIGSSDDIIAGENINAGLNSLRLPTTDTYTIFASRYGKAVGGTEGVFELVVSGTNIPQQLVDLNLPPGDIEITLTWETNADLQLLVRDPFGNSVYDDVSSVSSGGVLESSGNVNCRVLETSPVSYVRWPEGLLRIGSYEVEVWFQSECDDFRPVVFSLFIVVDGELIFTDTTSISFRQRYLTSFNIAQDGTAQGDLGGIIGGSETLNFQSQLASALLLANGDTVTGSITPNNKFDLYTFEGRAGDVVTISMNATSGTLDPLLFLVDPFEVEIADNDDSNESTNSLISRVRLAQDGTYTIIATHYGTVYGGTTGGYELAIRIDR